MFRVFVFLTFATLLFSQSFGAGGVRCGTLQFSENSKNKKGKLLAKPGCIPENYYGEVKERRTDHFIIYYTQQRQHAIENPRYIDSLAKYLEDAYKLHKDSLGMKNISGVSQTYHYQKKVPKDLYPVEVLDLGLLRGWEGVYTGTFGITFTPDVPWKTQIAIENDFLSGADCSGGYSNEPFISLKGVNYHEKWHLALKATTFHELYHSFQMMQTDITNNTTFWMEASATGVEEIGAPEVNDYVNYFRYIFESENIERRAVGYCESEDSCYKGYGYSVLYLFLFSELGARFDSAIWNYFSKYPKINFSMHLARLADSLNIDAEDLFHKFASRVFYSGQRTKYSPGFWNDMQEWPVWRIRQNALSILPAGSFDFIMNTNENPPRTDSVKKISLMNFNDSSVWVLSRLLEKEFVPLTPPKKFVAFPNPWKPNAHQNNTGIKFGSLPEKSTGVEIRSSNGILLKRIKGAPGDTLIWQPEKLPAPGILYYRTLPYGKNKVLILEY